ncbi:MAG: ChbG/HpnK family deacetylase [Oligoflexia bacterium]|nr:ChbG/HpnK family deacetylase [Oligoflexia bacterium]
MKHCNMNLPFRITIDDLGLFPEVEIGIAKLEKYNIPIDCSWVVNYCPPSLLTKSQNFRNGLHFNIIEGKSISGSKYLSDNNGNFNKSWTGFLFADKYTKAAVSEELSLQLKIAETWFPQLNHLDSHLHLHSIPWIFSLLEKEQKKRGIRFLRNPRQKISDDISIISYPKSFAKILILNSLTLISNNSNEPCYGLNRLFNMTKDYCISAGDLVQNRELVWHAADLPKNLDLDHYRFMSEESFILRKTELNQLEDYLNHLQF